MFSLPFSCRRARSVDMRRATSVCAAAAARSAVRTAPSLRLGVVVYARSFSGLPERGKRGGYTPLHNLADADISAELAEEELWHRLSISCKLITQAPVYGGLWIAQILTEARDHLDNIERHAEFFGLGKDQDLKVAVFHLRTRARELEMTVDIYREDPEWNG
jgi:hypothetical protein